MTPNDYAVKLESLRREKPTVDAQPIQLNDLQISLREGRLADMAEAGLLIEVACSHLRESIINGQKERTKLAQEILEKGVASQRIWLILKGYI